MMASTSLARTANRLAFQSSVTARAPPIDAVALLLYVADTLFDALASELKVEAFRV